QREGRTRRRGEVDDLVLHDVLLLLDVGARVGVRRHERWRDVERWRPPHQRLLRPVVPLPVMVPLLAPPRLALRPHTPVASELPAELLHLRRIRRLLLLVLGTVPLPLLGEVLHLPLHVDHVGLTRLDPLLAAGASPLRQPRPDRSENLRHHLRDHQQHRDRQRHVDQDRVFTHRRPPSSSAVSTPFGTTADRAAPAAPGSPSPTGCPRTSPSGGRRSTARRRRRRMPPPAARARATPGSGCAAPVRPPSSPRGSETLRPTPSAGRRASSSR